MKRSLLAKRPSAQTRVRNGPANTDRASHGTSIGCRWATSGTNITKPTTIMITRHRRLSRGTSSTSSTRILSTRQRLRRTGSNESTGENAGSHSRKLERRIHASSDSWQGHRMRTLRSGLLTRSGIIVRRGSEDLGPPLTRYAPCHDDLCNSYTDILIQGILQLHFQFKRVCFLPLFSVSSKLTSPRSITGNNLSRRPRSVINCHYVRYSIIITKQRWSAWSRVGVWIIAFIWI